MARGERFSARLLASFFRDDDQKGPKRLATALLNRPDLPTARRLAYGRADAAVDADGTLSGSR
jgi:hypothetical protein